MSYLLEKGQLSFDDHWPSMRPIILKLLHQEAVTRTEWQDLFWLVHTVCLWDDKGPPKVYSNLQDNILDFIRQAQTNVLAHQEDQALLKAYIAEWRKFFTQCNYLPMPFGQLELTLEGKPTSMRKKNQNEESVVRKLMLDSWNQSIFSNIKHRLQNSAMKLVHSERNGEAFDSQLVIGVRESYVNLCSNSEDKLQIYRENFEKAYIDATEAFYRAKAPQYLEANGVQNYMKYADQKLKEEEQRATKYLESYSGSIQSLTECCVRVLVTAFKEAILAECPPMIKNNETEKLQLMFKLMDRVPDGITPMLKDLEHHIINQGLADMIASADIITQDSEKYVEQLLELFTRFSKLVKEAFNDDPRFLTSRDKAFKQVVNDTSVFKLELSSKQKGVGNKTQPESRCPELLANYCDMLLRKTPLSRKLTSDEIEARLKEVFLVLKYVQNKDVFMRYNKDHLTRRLILDSSVDSEKEENMVEWLKIILPTLSAGSINHILNGEDVSGAVMQILGCKKIPGTGNDQYRLLISDGVTGCPFAMLDTQLNSLVTSNQLEKFTIVQVDKCVCNQVQPDRKVIILLNLTVLTPGADVKEKIGNPVNSTSVLANTPAAPATNETNNNTAPKSAFTVESKVPTCQMNGSAQPVHQIASLTPYQNKWTIKARVTNKTPVRTWSNSRGQGKLFSVTFLDESGEIRATGFNDAVDKFYEILEIKKVFYISRATLRTANNGTVNNDYEMTFNPDTTITPCEESASSIPMLQFDFVPIANIENIERDTIIDVIGVCKSASDCQTFVACTTNKELVKRDIKLVDRSNKEVNLTLWGSEAEKFDGSLNPVVAVKAAKVSDFNGRSLSSTMSSTLQVNPDIKEAHMLKGWYDRERCNAEVESAKGGSGSGNMGGQWKTFAQVNSEQLGMGDKPDYYVNKATVVMLRKDNCMYMACPSEECNKKVIDMNNGLYRCEKCNREYTEFKWRLLLSVSLADFTENQWVTCFQEAAESILGVTAQELGYMKESDEERFNEVLADANFKSYLFKLRTKMETYNEESRLKTIVVTATPVYPISYTKKILSDMKNSMK